MLIIVKVLRSLCNILAVAQYCQIIQIIQFLCGMVELGLSCLTRCLKSFFLTYNSISNFHPLFTFPVIESAPVTLTIDGIVKHVCSFHI